MKKEIEVLDYATHITQTLKKGVLVTTKVDDFINTMTISWGMIGIQWGEPIFIVYVREDRYTKKMLDTHPEFTINIPLDEYDKNIITLCGTKSGSNCDKINELKLTCETPNVITVPGIKELPLTLECKVIYKQKQDETQITDYNKQRYYAQDTVNQIDVPHQNYHTAYYGQIVSAYIIE